MAYVFRNGTVCWIHIPKCWGRSITEMLAQSEPSGYAKLHDGHGHDLPERWDYDLIFTGVREPSFWLRSFWGHRMNGKWSKDVSDTPYTLLSKMVEPYNNNDWDTFASDVTGALPGLIGWFFGIYTPPPVKVLRVEDEIFPFLESLGAIPGDVDPIGVNEGLPPMKKETRDLIIMSEVPTYIRYKYSTEDSKWLNK
jgi:hypothetical protein